MKVYETRELWLAAALELQGLFVTDILVERGTNATFQIEVPDEFDTDQLEKDYINNRLAMPVFALKEKIREMRTRMNKAIELNR